MKIPTNNITACILSLVTLALSGTAYAYAAETSGTITAQSAKSQSSLSGTLSTTYPTAVSEENSEEAVVTGTLVSRSGGRSIPIRSSTASGPGDDVIIMLDDGSIASNSGLNGTGGGFDPRTEDILAGASSDGRLSPEDAIAFNNSQNPFLANTDLTASAGDSGVSSGKIWTAVILGLLLVGLSGYAVYALAGYRRENEL